MEQSTYFSAPGLALPQLNAKTNRNKTVTKVISYLLGACTWEEKILFEGKPGSTISKGKQTWFSHKLFLLYLLY